VNISVSDAASVASRSASGTSATTTLAKIWDTIKDWFLGTNVAEAKQHLAQLYAPDASHSDRFASFQELKRLAGPAFQDRFSLLPQAFGYALEINLGRDLASYHHGIAICSGSYLESSWNKYVTDALNAHHSEEDQHPLLQKIEGQLMEDLPRGSYSVDGVSLQFKAPEGAAVANRLEALQKFRSALQTGGTITEQQRIAVEVLAAQGTFADIHNSALSEYGGVYSRDEVKAAVLGETREFSFAIKHMGEDLHLNCLSVKGPNHDRIAQNNALVDELNAKIKNENDKHEKLQMSPLMRGRSTGASLVIAPDGRVRVLSAQFCCPDNLS
jgi:hypothetical protein